MAKFFDRLRYRFGRAWYWIDEHIVSATVTTVVVVIIVIVLWPLSVIFVPAGNVGVLWSCFFGGTQTNRVYGEGTHVIFPWDVMTLYNTRIQLIERDFDVMTSDELRSTVNIAFRFRIDEPNAGWLHRLIGPDYLDVLLVPDIGSQARAIFARYSSEVAFTDKRRDIETLIRDAVERHLLENFNPSGVGKDVNFIILEDVLVRSSQLPPLVAQAIERKEQEANRAEAYDFTLEAEQKEAQRKEIEAQGIRRFQDIIKDGLTDNYLRWQGIQATEDLARSPNAKTVVIGSGPGGLPIILGNMDGNAAPAPPFAAVNPNPADLSVLPSTMTPPPLQLTSPAPLPSQPNVTPATSAPRPVNPSGTTLQMGPIPIPPSPPLSGLSDRPPASVPTTTPTPGTGPGAAPPQ